MIYQSIAQTKPAGLSFKKACQAMSVSPSGYFKSLKDTSSSDQSVIDKAVLCSFYKHGGLYGYRKLSQSLSKKGPSCSINQARRVLCQNGLRAKGTKPFSPPLTSHSKHEKPVSQRLFKIGETRLTAVNQVWGSDITYLRAKGKNFLYLAIFMDFYSRYIVGWDLSHSLSSELVLRAFKRALKTRDVSKNLMIHSDRGVQYTSREFREKLKKLGFIQSMSRKGNCYDNAYCESFFSLLKKELGNKVYQSLEEAKFNIFEWIEGWYNTHRLHSSLGYESPWEFENKMEITP